MSDIKSKLAGLQARTQGKGTGKRNSKKYTPDDVIRGHHILMQHYGWIPLKEFRELPEATYFNLLEKCQEHEKSEHNKFRLLIKSITGKDIGE